MFLVIPAHDGVLEFYRLLEPLDANLTGNLAGQETCLCPLTLGVAVHEREIEPYILYEVYRRSEILIGLSGKSEYYVRRYVDAVYLGAGLFNDGAVLVDGV